MFVSDCFKEPVVTVVSLFRLEVILIWSQMSLQPLAGVKFGLPFPNFILYSQRALSQSPP